MKGDNGIDRGFAFSVKDDRGPTAIVSAVYQSLSPSGDGLC